MKNIIITMTHFSTALIRMLLLLLLGGGCKWDQSTVREWVRTREVGIRIRINDG